MQIQTNMRDAACGGFVIHKFTPREKNTLRGFLTIELPSGLIIHDVTLHVKGDSRWVSMPAREFQKDGERSWVPVIEFGSKDARERFQASALAAVEVYLEAHK